MHITILTAGTLGDVLPYFVLGRRLVARGHTVCLTAAPEVARLIKGKSSLDIRAIADPFTLTQDDATRKVIESGGNGRFVRQMAEKAATGMSAFLTDCTQACSRADLLLYGNLGFAAPHIGESLGIPFFAVPLSPTLPTREYPAMNLNPPVMFRKVFNKASHLWAEHLFWRQIGSAVNEWRHDTLDLPRVPLWGPFQRIRRTGYPFIYLISSALFKRPLDWPTFALLGGFQAEIETDVHACEPELEAYLESGSSPVLVAFGPTWASERDNRVAACLAASARTNTRLLLCDPGAESSPELLEKHVMRVQFAPFAAVLPRVLAALHHGGAGTTYMCARFALPNVAFPCFGDQFLWAKCLRSLESGPPASRGNEVTVESLSAVIQELHLNRERYSANLLNVSKELQQEEVTHLACDLIELNYQRVQLEQDTM